jgi:hypothetical protein
LAGLLAVLLKSSSKALTILDAKVIAIVISILTLKSIAITIIILFTVLVIAVTLVLKQMKQKPVSGKHHNNASGYST